MEEFDNHLQKPTSNEVIGQAASILGWASQGAYWSHSWDVWREKLLGDSNERQPEDEWKFLQGMQNRNIPEALASEHLQQQACEWVQYYVLQILQNERKPPFWIKRWTDLRERLQADWASVDQVAQSAWQVHVKSKNTRIFEFPRTLWLVWFDAVLRWLALAYYQPASEIFFGILIQDVNFIITYEESTLTDSSEREVQAQFMFYFSNLVVIPILVFGVAQRWANWVKGQNRKLLANNDVVISKINFRTHPFDYALIFISTLSIALMGFYQGYVPEVYLSFFVYLPMLVFLYHQYSLGYVNERKFRVFLSRQELPKSTWNADENDETILELEARLKSMNRRLESYVLESALFGALALSGFLQIIAEELISFADVNAFGSRFSVALGMVYNFDFLNGFYAFQALFVEKKSLFCLLCYESLFCAVAFLVVIASRLRFSDQVDGIEQKLQIAHAFNNKEEQLNPNQLEGKGGEERKLWLNQKIREQLAGAQSEYEQTQGPVAFTRFFRNLGVGSYFVMLVTAGFFLNPAIALFFASLWLLAHLFFGFRENKREWAFYKQSFQDVVFRYSMYMNRAIAFGVLLSFVLRWEGMHLLSSLSLFFGAALYLFSSAFFLVFSPAPLGWGAGNQILPVTAANRALLFVYALVIFLIVFNSANFFQSSFLTVLGLISYVYGLSILVIVKKMNRIRKLSRFKSYRLQFLLPMLWLALFLLFIAATKLRELLAAGRWFETVALFAVSISLILFTYRRKSYLRSIFGSRLQRDFTWIAWAYLIFLGLCLRYTVE